ncbi:MAG: Short-chain dehydrogenase/reductase [Akkermansiaceae bacterium]|nr:Short-chain dehydrogenase/reductase [Akkermansiaceae bacterium]
MKSQVWLITGSSRGLGRALTEAVLAAGHQVIATARKPEQLSGFAAKYGEQIRTIALDVTAPQQAEAAVQTAIDAFGRLDVVVNNAGYGFTSSFEQMPEADFRSQIDTNFWGVVNVTRAALPVLRKQRSGHIIQVSSVGGRFGVAGLSAYHAAKFAVEGFSETVAGEIAPFGVKMTIVEPGGFRTDWATDSMVTVPPSDDYQASVGVILGYMEEHRAQMPGDPAKAAQAILNLTAMESPPLRLPLGTDALVLLRHNYQKSLDELEQYADITRSTNFDGLEISETGHAIVDSH